ncbi:MAG TPA: alpha/beta hydrolase-fold protein [Acidobacteriota bacterium]|nr:alpha/beta hydrolase-fold protein [Acidobacteriota bacterium]
MRNGMRKSSSRARRVWRNLAPLLLPIFIAAAAWSAAPQSYTKFEVAIDPAVRAEAVDGRILLLLSRTDKFRPGPTGTPVFGVNVDGLKPGAKAVVDEKALGHPVRSLRDVPPGEYYVQAWLNVYTTFKRSDGKTIKLHQDQGEGQDWRRSPGNLYSEPVRIKLEAGKKAAAVPLVLNKVVPPIAPYQDTEWLKHVRIQSRLLTEFWGQPMFIGANILLPKGYDEHPDVRYPVHYVQGHFPRGRAGRFSEDETSPAFKLWTADGAPRFIQVTFEHACPYYDDSYGVNSANVGPYGEAITTELIPLIEKTFRAIGEPWARVLSGGSTGGWISLALQVFYPDIFGGVWSFCPDPVDFRKYQVVDLYSDKNAYYVESEWTRVPRGGERRTDGNLVYTMEQENLYEEATGDRYRSGGQWAIWNAVFAPVAEDGYPQALWNPLTGVIDKAAAEWARERYDLRAHIEKNWPAIGAKLAGKIHVYVGRMDNFYLNEACYLLEASLAARTDPPYGGEFRYGDKGGHGWSPFQGDEMLREMAAHIEKSAPPGATKGWIY